LEPGLTRAEWPFGTFAEPARAPICRLPERGLVICPCLEISQRDRTGFDKRVKLSACDDKAKDLFGTFCAAMPPGAFDPLAAKSKLVFVPCFGERAPHNRPRPSKRVRSIRHFMNFLKEIVPEPKRFQHGYSLDRKGDIIKAYQ
jgi:hypothetical protein